MKQRMRTEKEKPAGWGKPYPPWLSLPHFVKVPCCSPLYALPVSLGADTLCFWQTQHGWGRRGAWGKAEEWRDNGCRRLRRIVQAELHGHAGWAKKKLDEQERMEDDTYCKEGLAQTVGEGHEYETESDLGQTAFAKTSLCFASACLMATRLLEYHGNKFHFLVPQLKQ